MKTILDIAKECGALGGYYEIPNTNSMIVFKDEAQLIATIEAWNRQNSELVGRRKFNDETLLLLRKGGHLSSDGLALLQSLPQPPQPQTVKDALEKACSIVSTSVSCDMLSDEMQRKIRALIDQPQPPASQELMDRIAELETSLKESLDYIDSFKWHWMNVPAFGNKVNKTIRAAITQAHNPIFLAYNTIQKALQSKPAKG